MSQLSSKKNIDHMRFRAEKENVSFEKYKNNLLKGIS